MDESTVSWHCPCGAIEWQASARFHRLVVNRLHWMGTVRLSSVPRCSTCGQHARPIMPSREAARRG